MMASTADAKVYGNTYDIPSHKWVMEMTQKELEDRGYVKKAEPEDPEETSLEGQTSPAVAKVSSRKKSTGTSTTK